MLCRIADLITEVPAAGGLAPRCEGYLYDGEKSADVVINSALYRTEKYHPSTPESMVAYMESATQFYSYLLEFGGFYLHASAVVYEGRAYLFSGPSGIGKSTHTRLWQQVFGTGVRVINDDKPALRRMHGQWIAYGTPWCGKDGINLNESAPLAGVCYLRQGKENKIRRLSNLEATQRILSETIRKYRNSRRLDMLLECLNLFLAQIPVYELECTPEPEAARISYKTMREGAQEAGL